MKFFLTFLTTLCLVFNVLGSVVVSWDANVESEVAGYHVLMGQASRTYTMTNTVIGRTNTSAVMSATNFSPGKIYVAVVAYNSTGLQSEWSNEVTWTNRPSPPKQVRISTIIQAGLSPTGPWTNLANVVLPVPSLPDSQFFRSRLLLEEVEQINTKE